jgi:hypothetical protein
MARTLNLAPIALMAFCAPGILKSDDGYTQFLRRYQNPTYAFSAAIPSGLVGSKTKPPAPAHGFFIELPGRPEARIDVNADYNTLDYVSGSDASAGETRWFVKQCSSEVRTESARQPWDLCQPFELRFVVADVNQAWSSIMSWRRFRLPIGVASAAGWVPQTPGSLRRFP